MGLINVAFLESIRAAFEAGDDAVDAKAQEARCVELVHKMYQAVTTGDIKTFGDMLADDVEMENVGPKTLPYTGHWRGANEMLGAVERNFKYLTVLKPEILSIVAQGDTVVVIGREVGVYLPTGRQYEADWVQQLTFADGKLKRFRQVIDASDILEGVFAERHR